MRATELVFELLAVKAKIKDVFSKSCCCYGHLLSHANNRNMQTNDWTVFSIL